MNEQRHKAYLQLIESLLNCPSGEEPELLAANQDLLDGGFLQTLEAIAKWYSQQGKEDTANWLENLHFLLIEEQRQQEYLYFLVQLLQKVSTEPSPDSIYPFLQENLDKLNDNFISILQIQEAKIRELIPESAFNIVTAIDDFSSLILQFSLGNRAINLEIAIVGYTIGLSIFTLEAYPQDWAIAQYNLGYAYLKRIKENKAENIEQAIVYFNQALQVYNEHEFPNQWAMIQNQLGIAYRDRIKGDRAKNIEEAIQYFQQAVRMRTSEAFPQDWAATQQNLGTAYCSRINGDKAENIEKAISCCYEALRVYSYDSSPQDWAMTLNSLGIAYESRIKESKAENIEQAIACYQQALRVYAYEAFAENWAATLNNLGSAYESRIKENKAENVEQAISCHQKALQVFTYEIFPQDWAMTLSNLSLAYRARIKGDKANNLEQAIDCLQQALRVRTYEAFPQDWAATQDNLGLIYSNRIKGYKADNLEQAINCFQQALRVRTYEASPQDWAATQDHLGGVYVYRIKGDRADNLEQAINWFQQALRVRTYESFPDDWGMTQQNLGVAYVYRTKGDRADNLEQAINCFQQALRVRTYEASPQDWAATQHNFGIVYMDRIEGDKADNLEQAINCFQQALRVRTYEASPQDWAMTQHNLGLIYSNRIQGDKAENLEQAITCYEEALRVRTYQAYPQDWAMTQDSLGNVYSKRIQGNKAENLKLAICCFQNALKIRTKESFPLECLQTARNLGNLNYTECNWKPAIDAYHCAIEAVETSRLQALTPQRRQQIISEAIDVYDKIIQSYLNLNQPDKALEYIERNKTRNLVELLTNREFYPKGNIPQLIISELDRLRREIVTELQRLAIEEQNHNTRSQILIPAQREQPILIDYTNLNQLRQQLDEFIEREITPIDPDFILTQEVKSIPFAQIQSLTNEKTAILEWYFIGNKFIVFVITKDELKVWESSAKDKEALITWIKEYLRIYYQDKDEYIKTLTSHLNTLSQILHINEIIEYEELKNIERLILIPHWFLHLLPLHALPLSPLSLDGRGDIGEGDFFCDRFPEGISYTPSCQLLTLVQNQQRPKFNKLFAIQNPTCDLLYTDLEVETISYIFPQTEVLTKQNASEANLKAHQDLPLANCIHFSCHGEFNFDSPLESALFLANQERLTLAEIFELSLSQCRLVTLSACETGLTDFKSFSDEYIGLPSGFLFAGSPSVVSSLWRVNDLSTALLMIQFYHHLKAGLTVAVALQKAQAWIRKATTAELQQWASQLELAPERAKEINNFLDSFYPDEQPFQEPVYWAAFCAIGQ
ncbi:MAG: tetratricopeptide repeat protein [Nostoc sp. ChiQUE01a]|nr:tetratricopeptide repeat protein [Nostoc sp. ChiQUE01a]